jgi:hypothetical protein
MIVEHDHIARLDFEGMAGQTGTWQTQKASASG